LFKLSLHFFFLEKKKTCAKTFFLKKKALPKKAYAANVLKKFYQNRSVKNNISLVKLSFLKKGL
jgi:hypothetical protein